MKTTIWQHMMDTFFYHIGSAWGLPCTPSAPKWLSYSLGVLCPKMFVGQTFWGAGQSFWDGGSTFNKKIVLFISICMYMNGGRSKLSAHNLLILYVWGHSWAGIFGYKCSNSIAILQNWLFRDVSLLSCLSDGRYEPWVWALHWKLEWHVWVTLN